MPYRGFRRENKSSKKLDPYSHDLIVNGQIAELKHPTTPFFKAKVIYGLDPQFTVTFNHKDYLRYCERYPNVIIYFWVDWKELVKVIRNEKFTVEPMKGLWKVSFEILRVAVEGRKQPIHSYQRRTNDNVGNAKNSYAFDLRRFDCLWQEGP